MQDSDKRKKFLIYGIPLLYILINFIVIIALAITFYTVKIPIQKFPYFLYGIPMLNILIGFFIILIGIILTEVNLYSKASFVLSLFFWVPALNIFTNILAIVFGVVALKEIKKDKTQKGRGLAIAGITIGIVTLILSFIGFLLYPEIYLGQNTTIANA